jgi:hypothetical protein
MDDVFWAKWADDGDSWALCEGDPYDEESAAEHFVEMNHDGGPEEGSAMVHVRRNNDGPTVRVHVMFELRWAFTGELVDETPPADTARNPPRTSPG